MASERILAIGTIVDGGDVQWRISPLPADEPQDGALQATIDYVAELQELIDGRLDDEYHASGNW